MGIQKLLVIKHTYSDMIMCLSVSICEHTLTIFLLGFSTVPLIRDFRNNDIVSLFFWCNLCNYGHLPRSDVDVDAYFRRAEGQMFISSIFFSFTYGLKFLLKKKEKQIVEILIMACWPWIVWRLLFWVSDGHSNKIEYASIMNLSLSIHMLYVI